MHTQPLIKDRLGIFIRWAFFFLLVTVPIHKQHKILKTALKFFVPNLHMTGIFKRCLYLYFSDLVLLAFAAVVLIFMSKSLLNRSTKYLTFFCLAAFLSLAFVPDVSSQHFGTVVHLCLFLTLFCVLENSLQLNFSKICLVILAISLLECALGISQYFLQQGVGLKLLGELEHPFVFSSSNCSLWIFDWLSSDTRADCGIIRAVGTFGHANIFGGFLAATIPFTYFLYSVRKNKLFAVAIFVQVFCLFLTFSRAAIFGLALASALWFFFTMRHTKDRSLLYIVFSATLLSICLLFPVLKERGGIVNYNQQVKTSDKGRFVLNDIAFEMIKTHPFFGIGYGRYVPHMEEFAKQSIEESLKFPVHNIYLLVAAETGLIGLSCFLLFLGSILIRVLRREMTLPNICLLSTFIGLLFIGGCDFYLLGSQEGLLLFFITAGLLASVDRISFMSFDECKEITR